MEYAWENRYSHAHGCFLSLSSVDGWNIPAHLYKQKFISSTKRLSLKAVILAIYFKWVIYLWTEPAIQIQINSLFKKAQQKMYILRQLKKTMLVNLHTSIIESILTSSITIWYTAATGKNKGRLQRVIHCAEKVMACNLPPLWDLYVFRTLKRAVKFVADPSHPAHKLRESLLSSRRLRSRTITSQQKQFFSHLQLPSSKIPMTHHGFLFAPIDSTHYINLIQTVKHSDLQCPENSQQY